MPKASNPMTAYLEREKKAKAKAKKNAVPLDKLCKWLDENKEFIPFCPDDKADCNSCELEGAECIKKRILLWMEEQNASPQ